MRFADYGQLLERVARVLESVVIPGVADAPARGQAWAAVGLIDNLATRLQRPAAALERELEELQEIVSAIPPELRADPAPAAAPASAEADSRALGAGRAELRAELTHALRAAALGSPTTAATREWLERVRDRLTAWEREELEAMRPTRYFKAMAGG